MGVALSLKMPVRLWVGVEEGEGVTEATGVGVRVRDRVGVGVWLGLCFRVRDAVGGDGVRVAVTVKVKCGTRLAVMVGLYVPDGSAERVMVGDLQVTVWEDTVGVAVSLRVAVADSPKVMLTVLRVHVKVEVSEGETERVRPPVTSRLAVWEAVALREDVRVEPVSE